MCCNTTKSLGAAKIENDLNFFQKMCFSGTIRGLALKLGYVVTLGVSSNFASFRGFCLKT